MWQGFPVKICRYIFVGINKGKKGTSPFESYSMLKSGRL